MKNIFKILFLSILFFSTNANAQLDTLNYLKQFEANKANYVGQPFTKLLNEMTVIQPKSVWPTSNFKTKHFNFSTNFKFCNIDLSFSNTPILIIEWQTPIPRNDTKYFQLLNHSNFTNDERSFYGSKIIKDIKVYR